MNLYNSPVASIARPATSRAQRHALRCPPGQGSLRRSPAVRIARPPAACCHHCMRRHRCSACPLQMRRRAAGVGQDDPRPSRGTALPPFLLQRRRRLPGVISCRFCRCRRRLALSLRVGKLARK
jgi:hypothetical protein